MTLGYALQDLPKHTVKLAENVISTAQHWMKHLLKMKEEIDRRVEEINRRNQQSTQDKSTTEVKTSTTTTTSSKLVFTLTNVEIHLNRFLLAKSTTPRATTKSSTAGIVLFFLEMIYHHFSFICY